MIITHPTALYTSIIPQSASDSGNVTYIISMTTPPKGPLTEIQLPAAIEYRKRQPIEPKKPDGQRVYTNTLSNASSIGSAKKQFEVGQVLEFGVSEESTLQPMLASNPLQIRHDTNILDLSSLGVSQEDITAINNSADTQFTILNAELSTVRQTRIDTETDITENQKNQNETKKAIAALEQLVQSDPSLQSVLDSLKVKLAAFVVQMNALVAMANEQADAATNLENRILAVAQMVR